MMRDPADAPLFIYKLSEAAVRICHRLYPGCALCAAGDGALAAEEVRTFRDMGEAHKSTGFVSVFFFANGFHLPELEELSTELACIPSIQRLIVASVYAPKVSVIRQLYKLFAGIQIRLIDLMDIGFSGIYELQPADTVPWYCTMPDPDFLEALSEKERKGTCTVLDVGAGSGHQALYLSHMGYRVTATELNANAFVISDDPPFLEMIVDDITATRLDRQFDYICDRGCFHNIDPAARDWYVCNTHRLLKPGGLLLVKALANTGPTPRSSRPFSVGQREFNRCFQDSFTVLAQTKSYFQGDYLADREMPAWFSILQRK